MRFTTSGTPGGVHYAGCANHSEKSRDAKLTKHFRLARAANWRLWLYSVSMRFLLGTLATRSCELSPGPPADYRDMVGGEFFDGF
jgi:hypothetical protein